LAALLPLAAPALAAEPGDSDAARTTTVIGRRAPPRTAGAREVDARTLGSAPRVQRAEDLLRLVPGLLVIAHGGEGKGEQLFLRGFDAGHGQDVELRVEGVPVNELSHVHGQGYVDLGFVIPEVVLGLDAHKGPFRLDQGNFALAGTVDYRLGLPRESRGRRLKVDVGTTGRTRGLTTYAPEGGPATTFFAAEAMHDDGFGRNRSARRYTVMGQTVLSNRNSTGRLDAWCAAHQGRFGLPGAVRTAEVTAGRQAFDGAVVDDTFGLSARALCGLHHHVHFSDGGRLESRLWSQWRQTRFIENYTGFLLDETHGDRRRQAQAGGQVGARTHYGRRLLPGLALDIGLQATHEAFEQAETGVDAAHRPTDERRRLDVGQQTGAALAGVTVRPVDALRVDVGGRFDVFRYSVTDHLAADRSGEDTVATPSPRMTLSWDVLPARPRAGDPGENGPLTLFAAYGRGFRAPEARSVTRTAGATPTDGAAARREYYQGGEPRITVADAVETGAEYRPHHRVRVTAAGFATFIDRELIYDHVSGLNLELNPTRRLGLEGAVEWRPTSFSTLRVDGTLVDARFVRSGNPVPNAPTMLGTIEYTLANDAGTTAGARLFHLGDRPLPFGARAGDTTLVDLSVGRRVDDVSVTLAVDNLLDARWRESEFMFASRFDPNTPRSALPALHGVAGPGRVFRLSLSLWM
jgi:hypothetical protein